MTNSAIDARSVMLEEYVSVTDLVSTDLRCPNCNGNNLKLFGNKQCEHAADMEDGIITREETRTANNFELENFVCLVCKVRFVVKTREVYYLQRELFKLAAMYEELTGKNPLVQG